MTFDPDLNFFSLFILVNTNSRKYSFLAMYSYTYTRISLIKYKAVINILAYQESAIFYIQLS